MNLPPIVYNGFEIAPRGENLPLTILWKAGGSDPSKQPSDWLSSSQAKEFVEFLNAGNSGILVETERGRAGGTWAHWQLAFAYAKYLSPSLHAHMNEVYRAHLEGQNVSIKYTGPIAEELFAQIVEAQMHMGKDVSWIKGKLNEICTAFWESRQLQIETAASVKELACTGREDPTAETLRIHAKVIQHFYFGSCPFYQDIKIVGGSGDWLIGRDGKRLMDIHHQYNRNDGALEATIPLSRGAHKLVESKKERVARKKLHDEIFPAYQHNVAVMMAQAKQLDMKF